MTNGRLVDRALAQTATAGLRYAVVPMPWMDDWFRYVEWCRERHVAQSFVWWRYCGLPGWEFEGGPESLDGDGNFRFCLLPVGHEGECAHP